jgi:hypothetical protein
MGSNRVSISLICTSFRMSLICWNITWRTTLGFLCFRDCALFLGLWTIFFFQASNFKSSMYLDKNSFGYNMCPKMFYKLNCISNGFLCDFLDLGIMQSHWGIAYDIVDKFSQPEYASIDMICIPHLHFNSPITAKLGFTSSQFYIIIPTISLMSSFEIIKIYKNDFQSCFCLPFHITF